MNDKPAFSIDLGQPENTPEGRVEFQHRTC